MPKKLSTRHAVLLSLLLLTLPFVVNGQRVPTPVATVFNIEMDNAQSLSFGWHLPLTGMPEEGRIGLVVTCDRPSGDLEAVVWFSFFPEGKPVQLAVRTGEGQIWRHGPPVSAPAGAGFHAPIITGRDEVREFLQHALQQGSLVSNGHHSFWNRLPARENRRAREALASCGAP